MESTAPYSDVTTCNTRPAARRTQAENRPVRRFQFRKDHESIDPIIHTTELGTYTKSPILHNLVVNLQWHPLRRVLVIKPHNTKLKFWTNCGIASSNDNKPLRAARCCHPRRHATCRPELSFPQRPRKTSMLKWSGNHSTDIRQYVV